MMLSCDLYSPLKLLWLRKKKINQNLKSIIKKSLIELIFFENVQCLSIFFSFIRVFIYLFPIGVIIRENKEEW